jgi:hypothetical protein
VRVRTAGLTLYVVDTRQPSTLVQCMAKDAGSTKRSSGLKNDFFLAEYQNKRVGKGKKIHLKIHLLIQYVSISTVTLSGNSVGRAVLGVHASALLRASAHSDAPHMPVQMSFFSLFLFKIQMA